MAPRAGPPVPGTEVEGVDCRSGNASIRRRSPPVRLPEGTVHPTPSSDVDISPGRRFPDVSQPAVRRAVPADLPMLERAWGAFAAAVPPPAHRPVDAEREVAALAEGVATGIAFVAETAGSLAGYAVGRATEGTVVRLLVLWVEPAHRRSGLAADLVRAVVDEALARGARMLDLEVTATNTAARTVFQRWGLLDELLVLSAPLERLHERLQPSEHVVSFASLHVQTDDRSWVERTAAQFAPRVGSPGSRVEGPRNGWTAVYDPVADGDPTVLLRYAREISDRMGAVVMALSLELDQVVRLIALDRGGIVDEYLSVPEFYGPLPPGDVIGLAANPTVLHRLTGADPAAVRSVARTAPSPADLPPARELLAAIADVLGLEGATYGFSAGA
jgi:ribosomal protein S18 acetylase RimI-like enzyme